MMDPSDDGHPKFYSSPKEGNKEQALDIRVASGDCESFVTVSEPQYTSALSALERTPFCISQYEPLMNRFKIADDEN